MTQAQTPEALRLAMALEESIPGYPVPTLLESESSAELRRQHAHIAQLEAELAQLRQAGAPAGNHIPDAGRMVPQGWKLVPVEFVQDFCTLAHNYSLPAVPPDYYCWGSEGAAFTDAYARCGRSLVELRGMLAASPTPPAKASKPVPLTPVVDPATGVNAIIHFKRGWKAAEIAHGIGASNAD